MVNWMMFALDNFGVCMFLLALLLIIFHRLIRPRLKEAEIVYRWTAIFPLALYVIVAHALLPVLNIYDSGFALNRMQLSIMLANVIIGLLGILSFNASYGFRLATVIAAGCWLWGNAAFDLYQLWLSQNAAWMQLSSQIAIDIFVPIILFICIFNLRTKKFK